MAKASLRTNCTICVPFSKTAYPISVECHQNYRHQLDNIINKYPEIFPAEIQNGYKMKDSHISKRVEIRIRRIEVAGKSYTIRPSFVMPYLTAFTDEVEKALFLTRFDVPMWGLARVFGKTHRTGIAWQATSAGSVLSEQPSKIPINYHHI